MKNTATLVDTGFLVALFNDGDAHHASAVRMLGELAGVRPLPQPQGRPLAETVAEGLRAPQEDEASEGKMLR